MAKPGAQSGARTLIERTRHLITVHPAVHAARKRVTQHHQRPREIRTLAQHQDGLLSVPLEEEEMQGVRCTRGKAIRGRPNDGCDAGPVGGRGGGIGGLCRQDIRVVVRKPVACADRTDYVHRRFEKAEIKSKARSQRLHGSGRVHVESRISDTDGLRIAIVRIAFAPAASYLSRIARRRHGSENAIT